MTPDLARTLPIRTRPLHLETPESYGLRLALANGLPASTPARAARQIATTSNVQALRAALILWCEVKGGLQAGHFGRQSNRAGEDLPARTMCRLCARGGTVDQFGHAESYCCLRHRLWVGPGTSPATQTQIKERVRDAELRYRRLRRTGRAPTALIQELAVIVNREKGDPGPESQVSPENYTAVVALAQLLTNQSFQRRLLTPLRTFKQSRQLLLFEVDTKVPGIGSVAVDGLWRLLRPAFLAVRDKVEGMELPAPAICTLLGIDPGKMVGTKEIQRPIEPFARYLDVLESSVADRWANVCELTLVAGQRDCPRTASKQGSWTATFICSQGHWSQRTLNTTYSALKQERDGCPFCAGLRPLAGFNSMAETHPRLAAEWHPTLNGSVTPSDVSGAGNSLSYWWICGSEHAWQATPNNRAKGQGCPFCSGRRCLPGVNTLDVTHPHVAAEWNARRNTTISPSSITAGSGVAIEWICPKGHEYSATPVNRTGKGTGCPVCANLRVLTGVNDLATTHPHIAAEWHPSLNGAATPQTVVAGSAKKYHWCCPKRHDYVAALYCRTGGTGCPVCAGLQVIAGYNDLCTTHPHIAAEWDHEANGSQTPESVIAGSARNFQWICQLGHRYSQPIYKRTAGSGCPYCSNRKVLCGFNDVATRHSAIARDWHPDKNGFLTPRDVVPGGTRRWWRCADGHEQFGTVPNRIKTKGCTKCPRERRVLQA